MTQERWTAIDRYITDLLAPSDDVLEGALQTITAEGLPRWEVAPNQGKLLMLLAQIRGARRILEIGTLGGYSTIWLGRALPADGHLITLESEPKHAEVARKNVVQAGLGDLVEVRLGPALETLSALAQEAVEPFDFTFIDADKRSNPEYLMWALKLSRPGAVIVTDNVVFSGAVLDAESTDPNIQGIRKLMELLATEPRLSATAVQTVGTKGHDGFAIAVVTE